MYLFVVAIVAHVLLYIGSKKIKYERTKRRGVGIPKILTILRHLARENFLQNLLNSEIVMQTFLYWNVFMIYS